MSLLKKQQMTSDDPAEQAVLDARYQPMPGKAGREGQKADTFLTLWLNLKIGSQNSLGRGQLRQTEREIRKLFDSPQLQAARQAAGAAYPALLARQIHDSARFYLDLCRTDPQYGSKMFSLIKMKDTEVMRKLTLDVYDVMIRTALMYSKFPERDVMVAALHEAYQNLELDFDFDLERWLADLPSEQAIAFQLAVQRQADAQSDN